MKVGIFMKVGMFMKVGIFMKNGKISENVYKRSILQQIKTKREEVVSGAGLGGDCAIFSFHTGINYEACPPLFGQGIRGEKEDINDTNVTDKHVVISCVQEGSLPVTPILQRCVNIMAARDAETVAAALSFLLPSDAEEDVLKKAMAEAEIFCGERRIQIAQAQGRVTAAVKEALVTVTAYGRAAESVSYHTVTAAAPEQEIVISKWIGLEGTAILAGRHKESLLARYPAWLIETAAGFDQYLSTIPEAAVALKSNVCAMHNVSEGGIFAALWELAEGAGVGLTIDLKKLPIRQETVEICNHCDVNPYELLSGGCLLMTSKDGDSLAGALEQAGIPAVVVGKLTDSKERLILNDGEVRYLDRPREDSIYKSA
ncbi:MAG: AIR synthase-related protein [Muribaculum sp.]|nr:AIR synthase-related protein [Muribaculum sp.]